MPRHLAWFTLPLLLAACAVRQPVAVAPPAPCTQIGEASWYQPKGRRTADGDRGRDGALIAAHRTLPFGTHVRVTDLDSGRSVIVRIDDRGPFIRGRIIDLSPAAAKQLGIRQDGLASVRLEIPATPGAASAGCPFAHADNA